MTKLMTHNLELSDARLSQIQTNWLELCCAKDGRTGQLDVECESAQRAILHRYLPAVYRYLVAATHDPNIADDLAQEFAYRFLRGDFRNVQPERGRFRHFLKRSLSNMVKDQFRRRRREPNTLSDAEIESFHDDSLETLDQCFNAAWRRDILARVWDASVECDGTAASFDSAILRLRSEHSGMSSQQFAEVVQLKTDRPMTAVAVRQALHRARQRFSVLLRAEVKQSLCPGATESEIDQEMMDLGLWKYAMPRNP